MIGVTAALLIPLSLTGCANQILGGPAQPDPAPVVKKYLTALSDGDATTAVSMDEDAVQKEFGDNPERELDALRDDEVLGNAEQRITDIEVETPYRAREVEEDNSVQYTYTLDGKDYSGTLDVRWDADNEKWLLDDTLAGLFNVDAGAIPSPLPFSVHGLSTVFAQKETSRATFYLLYPGQYTITAEVDPELLDGDNPEQQVTFPEHDHARFTLNGSPYDD